MSLSADGDICSTCKQSSNIRNANKEKDVKDRYGSSSADGLVEQGKKITKIEKNSRNQLSRSEDIMPVDFYEALEDELVNDMDTCNTNESDSYVGRVLNVKFQADAVIIDHVQKKKILWH